MTVRVLSYNLHRGGDDPQALRRVITAAAPEVALLQEGPRVWRWRRRSHALAAALGMRCVAAGAPASGNLLLLAPGVCARRGGSIQLPSWPHHHRRAVVYAELECRGQGSLLVLGTHLGLAEDERAAQVLRLTELITGLAAGCAGSPEVVLAGDFNADPTAVALQPLRGPLVLGSGAEPTWPAVQPRRRLDAVWCSPGIQIRSAGPIRGADVQAASDHLPVLLQADGRLR